MDTMTKQDFISAIQTSGINDQLKDELTLAAYQLIPSAQQKAQLDDLNDRRVQTAILAYQRYYPEVLRKEISLAKVMSFLVTAGSLPYIKMLEDRIKDIHGVAMALGAINPDSSVLVDAMTIVKLRCMSVIEKGEKPYLLRKKRRGVKRTA